MLIACYLLFFFFQAEDGIRDYKVTGVQTCALPISPISRPGTASCLMRNCGTKKLWITSCDLRLIRTGLPMGTCISSRNVLSSSVPNFPSGPGYVTCQLNCLAVTWITTSVAGIVILIFDQAGTLRNVSTTRISAGTTVQTISSVVLPCV